MELYDAESAFHTFEFILSNDATFIGKNLENNQKKLTDYDKQQLTNIVQIYSGKETLTGLMGKFVESYKIYLHFIGFNQGKFRIINEYSFLDKDEQRRLAFVVLNGDDTVCGPLFIDDLTGRTQAVFAFDDMRITLEVEKYIEKLNRTGKFCCIIKEINRTWFLIDPRLFFQIQEDPISTVDGDSSNGKKLFKHYLINYTFN